MGFFTFIVHTESCVYSSSQKLETSSESLFKKQVKFEQTVVIYNLTRWSYGIHQIHTVHKELCLLFSSK